MNRTAANAQHAAKLADRLAKALAKAVAQAPTHSLSARLAEISAEATATAKAAKIAADYAKLATSPEGHAEAVNHAIICARKVSALGEQAEREAREAGAL